MALTPDEQYFALRRVLTRTCVALDTKANQLTRSARASVEGTRWKSEKKKLVHRAEDLRVRSMLVWGLRLDEERLAHLCKTKGVPDDTRKGVRRP